MYTLKFPLFCLYVRAAFPHDTNFCTSVVSVFFLMTAQKWPIYFWDDDGDDDDDDYDGDDDDDDDNNNNNNNNNM